MKRSTLLLLLCLPLLTLGQNTDQKKYTVLDGKATLTAPSSLRAMTKDEYAFKYRNHAEPVLALTDDLLEVNLIVQPMEQPMKPEQMTDFTNYQVAQIKKKRSDAEVLGNGVKTISGHKVGWVKFIVKANDQKVYNHIFFTDVNGKAVLFNFNCPTVKQGEWAAKGDAIMAALLLK